MSEMSKNFMWRLLRSVMQYLLCVLLCVSFNSYAEVYKSVSKTGEVVYSNTPLSNGVSVHLDLLTRTEGMKVEAPKKIIKDKNANTQSSKELLTQELNKENDLLTLSKDALQKLKETPDIIKGTDGKVRRNVGSEQEKQSTQMEEIKLHEQNINQLRSQIESLK